MSAEEDNGNTLPTNVVTSDQSQIDFISILPDDVLCYIVSRCNIKVVARTRLLSTGWRHLWIPMSTLILDCNSVLKGRTTKIDAWLQEEKDPCLHYKDRFVRSVNQFLQFYTGSQLKRFKINYCLDHDSSDDIDKWVGFALSKGVKQLCIHLTCKSFYHNNKHKHKRGSQNRQLYTLKSELFYEGSNLNNLEELYLRSCVLGPGVIHQFRCLKVLYILSISLENLEIESILSCCLHLEKMKLSSCILPHKLRITKTHPPLECISVSYCTGVAEIELSAVTVTRFEYGGYTVKFSIAKYLNLETVYIRLKEERGLRYLFKRLGNDLSMITTLSVLSEANWVKCLPTHFSIFSNLKKLEFFCLRHEEFDGAKMIRILNSCPLLEKFYMVRSTVKHSQRLTNVSSRYGVHKHLKEVHMGGFRMHESYIKFVKLMMKYAVALERMIIDPQLKEYIGDGLWCHKKRQTWKEGERDKVRKQLKDISNNNNKVALVIM